MWCYRPQSPLACRRHATLRAGMSTRLGKARLLLSLQCFSSFSSPSPLEPSILPLLPQSSKLKKTAEWQKIRIFATSLEFTHDRPCPIDRQRQQQDTNMQNERHNTLTQREKYPPLSDCNSVSYSVPLQCNTSPAAHGQPRAGGAFLLVWQ